MPKIKEQYWVVYEQTRRCRANEDFAWVTTIPPKELAKDKDLDDGQTT